MVKKSSQVKLIKEESQLIFDTVDFLEHEINAKLLQLDDAREDENEELEELLTEQIQKLLSKLNGENKEMDNFNKRWPSSKNYEKTKEK